MSSSQALLKHLPDCLVGMVNEYRYDKEPEEHTRRRDMILKNWDSIDMHAFHCKLIRLERRKNLYPWEATFLHRARLLQKIDKNESILVLGWENPKCFKTYDELLEQPITYPTRNMRKLSRW